jgi:DNA primase catalytic core
MKSLFGLGRHPNAATVEAEAAIAGGSRAEVMKAGALGRPFNVYEGASSFRVRVARAFTAYNLELDRRWNAQLPTDERARIRSEIATAMFCEQHGRAPTNERELDGFVKLASRQATSAVAGYDLTFSPVKSVSVLWALAPRETADAIRAAHEAAVADVLLWIEREVAFTREGRGGVRQVRVRGLVATEFTHRDTRAGDPDLHTHLAVSNKVQTIDGRWLALDGRVLYQATVAASERYNTRLEAELAARLGVSFRERVGRQHDRRPVREVVGVSDALTQRWSRRRQMIESRRTALADEFQTRHGRPPTPVEAYALGDKAWRETRAAKHAPTSEAEQRAAWRAEAIQVLGGAAEVDAMVRATLHDRVPRPDTTSRWYTEAAAATLEAVAADRATWKIWHLRAEAERQARARGIALSELDDAIESVVAAAVALSIRLGSPDPIVEPAPLCRDDQSSVYDVHGTTQYTSTAVLAAERQLLEIAHADGGRTLSEVRISIALAESAADGIELNDAQAEMVRELAISGRRLQLALAPAGTGKTTAMRVLARAWTDADGEVLGLAPSAQAAQELRASIHCPTETLAKLTWTLAHTPRDEWPGWIDRIGHRSLVIIDEAAQASTPDLAAAARFIVARGGLVRLVGDSRQLASVGAGGVLRDIEESVGGVTLSEVRRFHDHAEAAATLAVREGDLGALGFYADHDRIHVGDLGTVTSAAYDAWAADRARGLDSVLLAPTRDLVSRLNARARSDRIGQPRVADSPEVDLNDGNRASVGDVIVTRRNERRLLLSATDWVKNGDRWIVTAVNPDRSLLARHHELGRTVRLPADYVAEHVQLGYATTVHGAQGITTDTAHTVVIGDESRELFYVAMSRGRSANHVYVANAYDGDPHTLIHPEALLPATAVEVLAGILRRDHSPRSATTSMRELDAPATRLHDAVARYQDAIGFAAQRVGGEALSGLDGEIEVLWPGLTGEDAYPTLRGDLALLALDGQDPLLALADAAGQGGLESSADRAAVLTWRLTGLDSVGPLPWLTPIPRRLATDPTWGRYLTARAHQIEELAGLVRSDAGTWSPAGTPPWAVGLGGDLAADVAVWRSACAVADTDARPTGTRQPGGRAAAHQQMLDRRVRAAGGGQPTAASQVYEPLPEAVAEDVGFARLTRRLGALANAGIDVPHLLAKATAEARPLPDEHSADALWWRIVEHLGPAALQATATSTARLRPAWTTDLIQLLGAETAERVMADSAWPALVAAVHARPREWTAAQLLASVIGPSSPDLRVEDLCSALVWRVATMTDAPDGSLEEPEDVEPAGFAPPTGDAHVAPSTSLSVRRIVQLNRLALDYYLRLFPHSWAPDYLQHRLGTTLAADGRFAVGYAPPGPTSLIRYLCGAGAEVDELIEAGLARRTGRGHIVDSFRDRLVFPIRSGDDLVGFIGRRNPTHNDDNHAGPKYLNTRATRAFAKGDQLFGLTESRSSLETGAVPVLAEGPLDAIAITLAGRGEYVGIAPLGTAFTDSQARQLRPFFKDDPTRIVIATDPDPAGWTGAQRAFWQLASIRANPRHLMLPDGLDPADLVHQSGRSALHLRLATSEELARALVDHLVSTVEVDDINARIRVTRDVGQVIGAMPPDRWHEMAAAVEDRLGLPTGLLDLECFEAGQAWTDDPHAAAARAIAVLSHRDRVLAQRPIRALPPTTVEVPRGVGTESLHPAQELGQPENRHTPGR